MFLHGFEQSALHLGRSTVNLVGKHEVGKHGTFLHIEAFVLLRVYHRADNVGGQQVGSELYAAVLRVDELRKGLDGQGLGQSGHTLEQDMAVAEQSYQKRVYQMALANYHTAHAHCEVFYKCTLFFYTFAELANVYSFCHCCVVLVVFLNLSGKITTFRNNVRI